jgi:ATP-binding cassette subfamily F protein uup
VGVLISAFQISKSFGAQKLFSKISFSVDDGHRVALIGPNGAGKSTLLKIIAKLMEADEGQLSFSQGLRLGYLEQNPVFNSTETIYDAILARTEDPHDPDCMALTWELIAKFGFEEGGMSSDKKVSELSGGWQKKVALAREMATRPNLLLLDEPTNHLDIESILWLEEWLDRQNQLACLIITHDRLFLQNTCDRIFDLDRKNPDGIIKFEGTYADFLAVKESLLSAQARLEDSKRNVLRQETAWLRRGAKARQTKQKARIERAFDLAEEVSLLQDRRRDRLSKFDFGGVGRSPKKLVEAQRISKSFGERVLFKDLDYVLPARARVGLLGTNGCGKSTLIKILLGEVAPDSGSVKITEGVKFSYFEQRKDSLDLKISVLRNLCAEGDYVHLQGQPVFARSYLSRFHFRPEQMDMPADRLSGGEQSRLLLARMMLQTEQVLILDEPTNDLDVDTLDTLQEALEEFPGAIILVTHDRYFMDQVATELLAFDGQGGIIRFADYFQWEEWRKNQNPQDVAKLKSAGTDKKTDKQVGATSAEAKTVSKRKLSYKEQLELEGMEKKILDAEAALAALQEQMGDPMMTSDYAKLAALTESIGEQQKKVDSLYQRWEVLNALQGQ